MLLDTTYARRAAYSGTAIYIQRLCEELRRLAEIDLVEVANRRRRQPAGGGAGSVRNLASDVWWTAVELPRLARRAGAQLIHHPLPALAPLAGIPQVVTVIDLAFERLPDQFDRRFRTYAHFAHRAAASAASAVIAVSETTAADARALWGLPAERIVVARLGAGQELAAEPSRAQADPTHFLYVGDEEPRKNLAALLDGYEIYRGRVQRPLELVLAGSASAQMCGVRVEHRPGPERLAVLYRTAAALVHPSLYEGFGLTALEAMSLGTPVIAARSPGILEVCADAARYADPREPSSLASAMAELAGSPTLRGELAESGRRRASEFSWAACARAHLEAYSLALRA